MKRNHILTIGLSLFFTATQLQAKVYHVKINGTGDGSSWETACGTLDDAIDKAAIGDEIWIAAGTYKPTKLIKNRAKNSRHFLLKDGVSFYGGFEGTETDKAQRKMKDSGKAWEYVNETILSGDDDGVEDKWVRTETPENPFIYGWEVEKNVVLGTEGNANHLLFNKVELTAPVTIDGLTLKGANAMDYKSICAGGAIYALGNVTITTCQFIENSCYFKADGDRYANGSAIYLVGKGNAQIKDCYFYRTYAHAPSSQAKGGAVYAENVNISNCDFTECVSLDFGGALFNVKGNVNNCTFKDCYARQGGAVVSDGIMRNNKIYTCRGVFGGGIYNSGVAINNIVANCFADYTLLGEDKGGQGGGVYNVGTFVGGLVYNCTSFLGGGIFNEGGKIINCTVQNNSLRKGTDNENIAFKDGKEDPTKVINTLGNGIDIKANFVKPTEFKGCTLDEKFMKEVFEADWNLKYKSEFIDKGEAITIENYDKDVLGNKRVMGKGIDFGAIESNPETAGITQYVNNVANAQTNYYTINGQYIGNKRPSQAGIYIAKTTNNQQTIKVCKVIVR